MGGPISTLVVSLEIAINFLAWIGSTSREDKAKAAAEKRRKSYELMRIMTGCS
jgi:hypothetical protein